MENKLAKNDQTTTHFHIQKGSNYKVVMSYGREEVITFEHFEKLAKIIYSVDNVFVTVNDIIVQVKDIRIIEPTKQKTKQELEEIQKKQTHEDNLEKRKQEFLKAKLAFQQEYFDNRYGEGNWKKYRGFGNSVDPNIKILDAQDFKDCQKALEIKNPELAQIILELDI